jgi:hypothetical protein
MSDEKSGVSIKIMRGGKEVSFRNLTPEEIRILHIWVGRILKLTTKIIFMSYDPTKDFNPEKFPRKKFPPTNPN